MIAVDYAIILLYFLVVIGLGLWYQKRASKNLDSYFLAGKKIHWLPLAMSSSVSTFDITGTMWIVSILFVLGMKSMWHHWMWGVYMSAFFMAYMGKWVRRSNADSKVRSGMRISRAEDDSSASARTNAPLGELIRRHCSIYSSTRSLVYASTPSCCSPRSFRISP